MGPWYWGWDHVCTRLDSRLFFSYISSHPLKRKSYLYTSEHCSCSPIYIPLLLFTSGRNMRHGRTKCLRVLNRDDFIGFKSGQPTSQLVRNTTYWRPEDAKWWHQTAVTWEHLIQPKTFDTRCYKLSFWGVKVAILWST